MIKLDKITKTYGEGDHEFTALDSVSLSIEKGEYIAIMGPSGSGKSTLMNILGALDAPTSGRYYLNDKHVSELDDDQLAEFRNKEVGFVFQQFNLLNKTSVYDNVALPGLYGAIKNLDQRVTEVLKSVGLSDKRKNKSNQLSGGQIQRVAIARALLMNPSIIMADEPTGNLDSKTGQTIMDLFADIHSQGNTVIVVTHEQDIAEHAGRIIKLKDGMIESDIKAEREPNTPGQVKEKNRAKLL